MNAVDLMMKRNYDQTVLVHTGIVWIGPSWAVQDRVGLRCRLDDVNRQDAASGTGRTELASRGQLTWQADYTMPPNVRVTVDAFPNMRWSVVPNTTWPVRGSEGGIIAWRADLVRAG